jgi:hypothetical protein
MRSLARFNVFRFNGRLRMNRASGTCAIFTARATVESNFHGGRELDDAGQDEIFNLVIACRCVSRKRADRG